MRKPKLSLPGPDDTVRHTLPNGITILARENPASPAVVIRGYTESGAEDEPVELSGLADFAVDVMARGTKKRTFSDLYEEVESIGASFGVNGGTHTTAFGAKGLAEHTHLLLDILNDTLRNPAFRPEQVEKARAEILTDLQEREHDTRRMANLSFYELTYPEEHPYHSSRLGYPETISRITKEDLVRFHNRYFSPQDMVITVVGAIKAEEAVTMVADTFGDWEAKRPARAPLPPIHTPNKRKEKRVAIPEKTQSNLVLGWPGPERLNPDFYNCFVTNVILGVFGMYGRLGKRVREENGLAYYSYSRISGGIGPGPWRILAGVHPSNIDKAIALILEEIRRLRDTKVPQEELQDSQSFLTGSLPLQLETNEGVARSLINIEHYNLGLDYLQRYRDIIMGITVEGVQMAAQRWLDPENFALAIAEPATEDET